VNIHTNPALLARALGKASKNIKAVTYEYAGIWRIETAQDVYLLGDAGGCIGWNIESGALGEEMPDTDSETSIPVIALCFAYWLETLEGKK
jgi:hypothetical protein